MKNEELTMKQLLRYTSTLLRAVLLFGILAYINIPTKAQTATMPDAFETVDPTTIIGNGNYYYIQFNNGDIHSFLGEFGESKKLTAKDYIPYANNIMWTLERTDTDGQFKLKSKNNYYVYKSYEQDPKYSDRYHYYFKSSQTETPAVFTLVQRGDLFVIQEVGQTYCLGRDHGNEWGDIFDFASDSPHAKLRFATLKPNVAHIIYYRGEGVENGQFRYNFTTTRHYLTYSGIDHGNVSLIDNGSLEGTDVSCFYSPTYNTQSSITGGIGRDGSRGISVVSSGNEEYDTSTQFFIKAKNIIPIGTKVCVEFDYRAADAVSGVSTQAQAQPGQYNHWDAIGSIDFKTKWQHFRKVITVTEEMGNNTDQGRTDTFQSIAFNLGKKKNTTFYFDNIVFTILGNTEVSSRLSIIPKDTSIWALPTAAAYHQDGLWDLIPTGSDGEFYIKKHGGSENDYLTTTDDYKIAGTSPSIYYTVLGNNNNDFSKYILETPGAYRYTRVKNNAPSNVWGYARYMSHSEGDGYPVLERYGDNASDADFWYAGFLPVEVPTSNKDEFYNVILKIKNRTDNRIKVTREDDSQGSVTVLPLEGVDTDYGATFTVNSSTPTNVFQIKNLPKGCYTGIVIEFGTDPIPTGYSIHTYGETMIFSDLTAERDESDGIYKCVIDLSEGGPIIDDFTIFTLSKPSSPLTITACYFTPEGPESCDTKMLNHEGGTDDYDESVGKRKLWHLEQVEGYSAFRLRTPNGKYFQADGVVTTNVNDAKIFTNEELLAKFDLKFFLADPLLKEHRVDKMITHKMSYLQQYAKPGLDKQGLATDADSEWWNFGDNTQKVNHFAITHYVKRNESVVAEFPTILNDNNDHIYYQRFYHYNDTTCDNELYPDGTDMDGLTNHVSIDYMDSRNNVSYEVQRFRYLNGLVTGEKLKWGNREIGNYVRKDQRTFTFTNTDGKNFTVAVDVSRYSDMTYYEKNDAGQPVKIEDANTTDCYLEEPSLTMRYLYYMRDAKVMAQDLTSYPEQPGVDNKTTWKETGTVCVDGSKWMEKKEFHFPAKPLPYENEKWVGYRGEFIGLRHVFSDYWAYNDKQFVKWVDDPDKPGKKKAVIDVDYIKANYAEMNVEGLTGDQLKEFLDGKLVHAVNDNSSGRIEVRIYDPNNTGIRLGGWNSASDFNPKQNTTEGNDDDYLGFYFYDKVARNTKTRYGDSRFVVFRYPKDSEGKATAVADNAIGKEAYIHVYLNAGDGTRYQLAQFTVIFDANSETLPWVKVNSTNYPKEVKNSDRDPKNLFAKAGDPIAKVTFDYPTGETYHYPDEGLSRHDGQDNRPARSTIANSSPIPLTFDHTNYAFDGNGCNWGSYAMVGEKRTTWGNDKTIVPVDDATYGYNRSAGKDMQKAFLYIDASEQPGDICAIDFQGKFCTRDKLMCSGWISGSNRYTDNGEYRCPGSITLTVKGEDSKGGTNTIYRFCPGQCYELDNGGTGFDGAGEIEIDDPDNPGQTKTVRAGDHVIWQQFYFEFSTDQKYERYWLEVNNNCVSSNGGDFMLDNIEVYCIVPEVKPEMNTPICVDKNDNVDMRLLKLKVDYNKLKSTANLASGTETAKLGFVFLDKEKFLKTLKDRKDYNGSVDQLAKAIKEGKYNLEDNDEDYKAAFDAALLGNKAIWDSTDSLTNLGAGVLYFKWNTDFESMEQYTFAKAVEKKRTIFKETIVEDNAPVRYIVVNGNYPVLPWKANTEYYIVPSNAVISDYSHVYESFNICSECSKASVFKIDPPYSILGLEKSEDTDDYVVCEGQLPTIVTDLKGYDLEGNEVAMKELNFDWWIGNITTLATLENYHDQEKGGIKLDRALSALRAYYPEVTSLEGLSPKNDLTLPMIQYLQELVDEGELILHQKSISVPAVRAASGDPYFYLVACPIHDGYFDKALNPGANKFVSYFCDEPQGLRVKVGEKAPALKCGFVNDENGFGSYDYSAAENVVLSVRLAKKAQFETVKHGEKTETPVEPTEANGPGAAKKDQLHYLWLPVRNALVQSSTSEKVIQKSGDENIYLASTDDPEWDKLIYQEMSTADALPIVGKIVQLNAIDVSKEANSNTTENDENRLCIYFTTNFDVREGYSYTLSLPFKEAPGTNTCDGTLLINLKIVPDYEVWTGGADNTDWNNDQNWRRADGNMVAPSEETTDESGLNNNELLVSADLPASSGLHEYVTNYVNYRTAKDRLLRKGFAPLYCTHILMKSNEWGDAPVLYDALNGKTDLDAAPFPNLSEDYDDFTNDTVVDQRFTSIEALLSEGQPFAIVNETDGKAFFGTTAQNLGYGSLGEAMKETNTGYYFKLKPGTNSENYFLRLQTPAGVDYEFDAPWGGHYHGYLNSQPLGINPTTGQPSDCCFILGLGSTGTGQDGDDLALWIPEPDGNGKFALKNVGTGKYLRNNAHAKFDEPTYFTFCTLKGVTIPTRFTRANVLKYDMQTRLYDIWTETYKDTPNKGREGDLIAEMYQINSCDEIAFQPATEMKNAHLLNYNSAWVEYQLDMNRWYLLGSSLRGTISGEWYAPTGTAQQKTTYYEPVRFGTGYDRYSPAIYQRSWDKAKAVLYEVGADYHTTDNPDDLELNPDGSLPGYTQQGQWSGTTWNTNGADTYLDRLGYKPLGDKMVNVAMKGLWSNTYNDATVDYTNGGFSVMVMNNLKGGSNADPAIVRLPKEDTWYDYYEYSQSGADKGGTDTYLSDRKEQDDDDVQTNLHRALNRGRLKTDRLLPANAEGLENYQKIWRTETTDSCYGDQRDYTRVPTQKGDNALPMTLTAFEENLSAGVSNLGYYMVANPFQTGLNMDAFFTTNNQLRSKYWMMVAGENGQPQLQLVQQADDKWVTPSGDNFKAAEAVLAPGQGFFVEDPEAGAHTTVRFTDAMQAKTRFGKKSNEGRSFTVIVGKKKKMTTKQETITMDDGTQQTITLNVPVVDENGNYELEDIPENITIYSYVQDTGDGKEFPLRARTRSGDEEDLGLIITAQRGGLQSSTMVMQRESASNDFLPEEDTEVFTTDDIKQVPTVYTLCGRLATTINSIRDFRCLPIGVTSASDAPCVLTFQGVETLGDSVAFYDAVERQLTPLESGMTFTVSGQTQNRYYLVHSLNLEEAAEETHLQISVNGMVATVIASTQEPLTSVCCYDTAGRLVYDASPQTAEHRFNLPATGVYIIEAQTNADRKTSKVSVNTQ